MAMATPRPPRVVPGEASESDSESESEPEPGRGVPGQGLKVPGEASETDEEEEEEEEQKSQGAEVLRGTGGGGAGPVPVPGGASPGAGAVPSLLQQRLRAGSRRLRGSVEAALRLGLGSAARELSALGQALGRAQGSAAAAAHCLRLARADLRSVAAAVDIVTACRLLPDIRCRLPPLPAGGHRGAPALASS